MNTTITYKEKVPAKPKKAIRGLGDVVAIVADPIAKFSDKVLGTHLENCGGCKGPQGRQEWLNKRFPLRAKPETNP